MTVTTRIWLELSHHAAFRVGGWAFVRAGAEGVTGTAAGERRIDAERAALLALTAAVQAAGRAARVETSSAAVAALPARLTAAQAGEDPPADNLDLWARLGTLLAAGGVEVVRTAPKPGGPLAFAAGWAELARDKAKGGPFSAAIPKSNLAKAGVG